MTIQRRDHYRQKCLRKALKHSDELDDHRDVTVHETNKTAQE